MIYIKSIEERIKMQKAGEIVALVLKELRKMVKPGLCCLDLNQKAFEIIKSNNAYPSFKGYKEFPSTVCISINEEIIHGIPKKKYLQEGDIVSIDVGACKDGLHGDAAITVGVGNISSEKKKIIEIAEKSFYAGMYMAREGNYLGDICSSIQETIENAKLDFVKEFSGHGIGRNLHEKPSVPNYGKKKTGLLLKAGMTIAIEPMVINKNVSIEINKDNWTVVTSNKSCSAHYENTILITKKDPIILTKLYSKEEKEKILKCLKKN